MLLKKKLLHVKLLQVTNCTTGTITLSGTSELGDIIFNNCGEVDPECGTGQNIILNGTLDFEVSDEGIYTMQGTLTSSGLISKTCAINITMDTSYIETNPEDGIEGTICGYSFIDIAALTDFTSYCKNIE
jgi:hypothetical protein